jgi:methionyl-tRNA formyltransferase
MSSFLVQILGTRAELLKKPVEDLGCRTELIAKPEQVSPKADICLGSGVHYIIKKEYLHVPRLGVWGFHETALPEGRGCAPLQWTVLNGKAQGTVSFFQMVEKFDAGPLLGQESFPIARTDLLEDIRNNAMAAINVLLKKYLLGYLKGEVKPHAQNGEGSYYRKRTAEDSRLDLTKPLGQLWDLIRVCDNDAYPAWFELDGQKFIIKRERPKA